MYKVKFFGDVASYKCVEEEINEFLKDNDVIPIAITYDGNYYALLYMEKGE